MIEDMWHVHGLVAIVMFSMTTFSQEPNRLSLDPFQQHIAGIELKDQSVIDGAAIVGQQSGLAISVEFELGASISRPAPVARRLTARVVAGTVSNVLDQLCALDPTFAWVRTGNMINLLPRSKSGDPDYFLNRRIDQATLSDIGDAQQAVFAITALLPAPKEQIAVFQTGGSVSFARPWTITFHNVTVRDIFDQVAQHIGSSYGWQFGGANDFRLISFHRQLLPNPSRSEPAMPNEGHR